MTTIETAATDDADRVLSALVELLASVDVATLEDPSKLRVANTCALAALVARDIVLRHGLEGELAEAVRVRMGLNDIAGMTSDTGMSAS